MRIGNRLAEILIALLLVVAIQVDAQQIKVTGKFLADSLQIGETIPYSLTVRYPKHLTALLPDSTYSFAPFEFVKKRYQPTRTQGEISYDSVVYFLQSFEVDKIQLLSLPVFIASGKDCTVHNAIPDSIYFAELIKVPLPDSLPPQNLPLKTITFYEKVLTQFNYVLVGILCVSLLLIGLLSWILFGKRIITYFKMRRLEKNHRNFINDFSTAAQQLEKEFSRTTAEQIFSRWKKYMEQLDSIPYTKLTSKEIIGVLADDTLGQSLHQMDRAIYGGAQEVTESLNRLREESESHYHKRLQELKHG